MTLRNLSQRFFGRWSSLLAFGLVLGGFSSCACVRPLSRYGHDLLQNDGYSAVARVPAGIGAMIGHIAAFPFGVILLPSYAFDGAVVWNADGYPPRPAAAESGETPSTESPPPEGDFYLPLAGAPFEYGSGMGAAFVGAPFEYFMRLFREPPAPPVGTVKETPELPPGEPDPDLNFDVKVN